MEGNQPTDANPLVAFNAVIFDNSPIFVDGLARLLEQNRCSVIASIASLDQLELNAETFAQFERFIFFVGPHLHLGDAFAACRWAKSAATTIRTIFITELAENELAKIDANFVGVLACLSPDVTPQGLISILPAIDAGCSLMSLGGSQFNVETPTPRELEVLTLIAQEKTDIQIAETLSISPHTAKSHAKQIISKFGVRSRTDAVRRAIHRGWIFDNPK
ncbi:MAG: response regulator transcription factor [Anaerolineae bacterium]|nr:response regulator transcription factor [Anaerolineae bacterium]